MAKKLVYPVEWNLKQLYKGDKDPRIARDMLKIEKSVHDFVKKWSTRQDYLENPVELRKSLDDYEKLMSLVGNDGGSAGYYIWLRSSQDQSNSYIKAQLNKLMEFLAKLQNQIQFYEIKLGAVAETKQKVLLASKLVEPYHHFLARVFALGRYNLSEAEERIINLKSNTASEMWIQTVSEFIAKERKLVVDGSGKKRELGEEELLTLAADPNPKLRQRAGTALDELLGQFKELAAAEINAIYTNKKIDDELRGFTRPDVSRHLGDDIETEVVDALVKAVSGSNSIARQFYSFKAKLIGQKQLQYYERNVDYGKQTKVYDYSTAVELVDDTFAQLDPEFSEIFQRLLKNGQVDVYPRKGKHGGAFCAYNSLQTPTFLLLNYTNSLRDVTTLAHEMGHAINDELMRVQNSLNFGTSTATAEVASQYMEDFVVEKLENEASDEERLVLQVGRINDSIGAIYRQIACYQFEMDLHLAIRQKGFVSADEIGKLFSKRMQGYMGPAAQGCENWWVYWSHIRRYFYVYSYAGGLLIAKAMQAKTRENPEFVQKVKQYLAAGASASSKELFALMDFDISSPAFWKKGLAEVGAEFKVAQKLAKKLGKIWPLSLELI